MGGLSISGSLERLVSVWAKFPGRYAGSVTLHAAFETRREMNMEGG
ncbi:MAG: hypothetical protein LBU13_08125 [Synergistaceae bacterium]|nr:hypothetical protein [Synergistaceae bacterium]